jgi:hypothetical protein
MINKFKSIRPSISGNMWDSVWLDIRGSGFIFLGFDPIVNIWNPMALDIKNPLTRLRRSDRIGIGEIRL